jgi:hypothetical protein
LYGYNAVLLRIVSKKVREKEEVVSRVFQRNRRAVTSSRVLHAWRTHAAHETRAVTALRKAAMRMRNVKCAAAFAAWASFTYEAKRLAVGLFTLNQVDP